MSVDKKSVGYLAPVTSGIVNGVGFTDSSGLGLYPNGITEMFTGGNKQYDFEIFFFVSTEPQVNAFLWRAVDAVADCHNIWVGNGISGQTRTLYTQITTASGTQATHAIPITFEPYTWYHLLVRCNGSTPQFHVYLGRRGVTALGGTAAKDTFPYGGSNGGYHQSSIVESSQPGLRPWGQNSFSANRDLAVGGRLATSGDVFVAGNNWPGGFAEARSWQVVRPDVEVELDAGRFVRGRNGTEDDASAVLRTGLRHCFRFNLPNGTPAGSITDQGAQLIRPFEFYGSPGVVGIAAHPFLVPATAHTVEGSDQLVVATDDSSANLRTQLNLSSSTTSAAEIDEILNLQQFQIVQQDTTLILDTKDSNRPVGVFNLDEQVSTASSGDARNVTRIGQQIDIDEEDGALSLTTYSFAGSSFGAAAGDSTTSSDAQILGKISSVDEEDAGSSALTDYSISATRSVIEDVSTSSSDAAVLLHKGYATESDTVSSSDDATMQRLAYVEASSQLHLGGTVLDSLETRFSVDESDARVHADTSTTTLPGSLAGGILISIAKINSLPAAGPAWDNVVTWADTAVGDLDPFNQNSNSDIVVLAAALVYARTGTVSYRTKVKDALLNLGSTEVPSPVAEVLGLCRNIGTYVIAADILDQMDEWSVAEKAQLVSYFSTRRDSTTTSDGRSVVSCHETRPNNFGTHAGFSRMMIDKFIGDETDFLDAVEVAKRWFGDPTSSFNFLESNYGTDTSWQAEAYPNFFGINRLGTTLSTGAGVVNIDGGLPEELRRAGVTAGAISTWPDDVNPETNTYNWEAMQGATMQCVLLHNQGYNAFEWSDQALLRAHEFITTDLGDPAVGDPPGVSTSDDDTWQPWIINYFYGTSYTALTSGDSTDAGRPGKNFGFADWLYEGVEPEPGQANVDQIDLAITEDDETATKATTQDRSDARSSLTLYTLVAKKYEDRSTVTTSSDEGTVTAVYAVPAPDDQKSSLTTYTLVRQVFVDQADVYAITDSREANGVLNLAAQIDTLSSSTDATADKDSFFTIPTGDTVPSLTTLELLATFSRALEDAGSAASDSFTVVPQFVTAQSSETTHTEAFTIQRQVYVVAQWPPEGFPFASYIVDNDAIPIRGVSLVTSEDFEDAGSVISDSLGLEAASTKFVNEDSFVSSSDALELVTLFVVAEVDDGDTGSTEISAVRETGVESSDLLVVASDEFTLTKVETTPDQVDSYLTFDDIGITVAYFEPTEDLQLASDSFTLESSSFFSIDELDFTTGGSLIQDIEFAYNRPTTSVHVLNDEQTVVAKINGAAAQSDERTSLTAYELYVAWQVNAVEPFSVFPWYQPGVDEFVIDAAFNRAGTDISGSADSFEVTKDEFAFGSVQESLFSSDTYQISKVTGVGSATFDDLHSDLTIATLNRVANAFSAQVDSLISSDDTQFAKVVNLNIVDNYSTIEEPVYNKAIALAEQKDIRASLTTSLVQTDSYLQFEDFLIPEDEGGVNLITSITARDGTGSGDGSSVDRVIDIEELNIFDTHDSSDVPTLGLLEVVIELIIGDESGNPATLIREVDLLAIEDVWNEALTLTGSPTVSSISDGSSEAEIISRIWDNFRCTFIGDHTWNGAVTIRTLARKTDEAGAEVAAPIEWGYVYALPADYCRAWRINGHLCGATEGQLWQIKALEIDGEYQRVLLANAADVDLEYIFDVGNMLHLLTPQTRSAMAYELAVKIAPRMGLSEQEIQGLRQRASIKVAEAKGSDGQEGTPIRFPDTSLLDARNTYRGRW